MSCDPCIREYFSENWGEARKKFLDAANAASARIESLEHPAKGPQEEKLFTDIGVLGSSNPHKVVFVCSGTHGVEGFAGSGVQVGLLRQNVRSKLPADTRLVLIHGINPFGFAHLRRFNEDNIDLNRNFRDHNHPYPENPGYDALAEWIAPKSLSFLSEIAALLALLVYAARHGVSQARAAVTSGQYRHPQGLFFGGHSETWSAGILREIVKRYGEGAQNVVFIDIHTGLGRYKHVEIILNSPKGTGIYRRARKIWGGGVKTTKADKTVSADLTGTSKLAIPEMLPDATVTAITVEIGTVPSLWALRALRAENWLHHFGGHDNPRAGQIKTKLLRAFYPEANDWRRTVWNEGADIVGKAIDGL